ncbi:TIGR03086 family metal-binding protein [Saccharomonospora sp. NPDC006951]
MLTNLPDNLPELDAHAVRAGVEVVERVTAADLALSTPCAAWTLGDLLAHMTAQHHGFAAAAEGEGADPGAWRLRPLGDDPVGDYVTSANRVLAAFARPGVLERPFALPEVRPGTVPGKLAVSFHFVDYVVHGWDVAVSLGVPFDPGVQGAEAALRIALQVPGGDSRLEPDAAFGPVVPAAAEASTMDRVLAALGRSPQWTPATAGR